MPLTTTQIRFLRAALDKGPLLNEAGNPREQLPFQGAVAHTMIRSLTKRGLIDCGGQITQAGRGALLNSPQAMSEQC